jgi:SAM-dependent methyltransferase
MKPDPRNPTGRFTGLSEVYAKYRPSYPSTAIDAIISGCGLTSSSLLVDVGSGTGISSRLFADRGIRVLGIEPNAEMRAAASAHAVSPGTQVVLYQDGRAEATGLPTAVADAVLAAQAFHWFDPDGALSEFHRILKPNGWAILMWNERNERDHFTAAYGAIIRNAPDALATELPRGTAGKALLASRMYAKAEKLLFCQEQTLDEEGLVGRAFSASYAPRDPDGREVWMRRLGESFARWQSNGTVRIRYETSVYLAQRGNNC